MVAKVKGDARKDQRKEGNLSTGSGQTTPEPGALRGTIATRTGSQGVWEDPELGGRGCTPIGLLWAGAQPPSEARASVLALVGWEFSPDSVSNSPLTSGSCRSLPKPPTCGNLKSPLSILLPPTPGL